MEDQTPSPTEALGPGGDHSQQADQDLESPAASTEPTPEHASLDDGSQPADPDLKSPTASTETTPEDTSVDDGNQQADPDLESSTDSTAATPEQPEVEIINLDNAPVVPLPELPRRPGRARLLRFEEGVLLKKSFHTRSSESAAMEFVREHAPDVPVPYVYYSDFTTPPLGLIFMEEIPGENLENTWPGLTPSQKEQACQDIWDVIMALRKVPRPQDLPTPETLYTTVDGSYMYHHGLLGNDADPVSPELLDSDDAFREFIIERYRDNHGPDQNVIRNFPHSAESVFTHGDIKPKNIMVSEDGRILSLIDWEYAGFMPDYWEDANMFMLILPDEKEWAEVMRRTKPSGWDFDTELIRTARKVLHY